MAPKTLENNMFLNYNPCMKIAKTNRFCTYALLILLIVSNLLHASPSLYDSQLIPIEGELGYQKRGNRYEGFYEKKCGGSLEIVSLMYGGLTFDWHPSVVITVAAPQIKKTINVRARAIPPKTYYQMDSQISSGNILKWPISDVIYKAQLKPSLIGVFGWITEGNKKTFVPLTVSQHDPIPNMLRREVVLIVRPDVDVETVIYRFFILKKYGNVQPTGNWIEIDNGIDAGYPIKIELPRSFSGSKVVVEIKAKPRNRGTWLRLKINVLL